MFIVIFASIWCIDKKGEKGYQMICMLCYKYEWVLLNGSWTFECEWLSWTWMLIWLDIWMDIDRLWMENEWHMIYHVLETREVLQLQKKGRAIHGMWYKSMLLHLRTS